MPQRVEFVVMTDGVPGGRPFASTVESHDGGLPEGGSVKGACRMGHMMLDKVPAERSIRRRPGKTLAQVMRYAVDEMAGSVDDR